MPGRRVGLIPNFLYCPHPPGLIYLDDVVGPSRVLLPVYTAKHRPPWTRTQRSDG
jgi:hypothetical protein